MKLERQPSNLIDSFAQTETNTADHLLLDSAAACSSNDMVDSGVGSQHKSTNKERNPSVMDDDEDISFTDDRLRYKNVSEEEEEENEGQKDNAEEDDKKYDEVSDL